MVSQLLHRWRWWPQGRWKSCFSGKVLPSNRQEQPVRKGSMEQHGKDRKYKVVILSSGQNSSQYGYEEFSSGLATQFRIVGLEVEDWGVPGGSGRESPESFQGSELEEFARRRLATDLHDSTLKEWATQSARELSVYAAVARIQKVLHDHDALLIYFHEDVFSTLIDRLLFLQLLTPEIGKGNVKLMLHVDCVRPSPFFSYLRDSGAFFHAPAPWIGEELRSLGVAPSKIFEQPKGIYTCRFRNCRWHKSWMRRELKIPEDAFVILSVDPVGYEAKNHLKVLKEIASLRDLDDIWWVVASESESTSACLEVEARISLGPRFVPATNMTAERMYHLYGTADLLVSSGFDRTLGLTQVQAHLVPLPFVIQNSREARWVSSHDPLLLSHCLVDMHRPGAAANMIQHWREVLSSPSNRPSLLISLENLARVQDRRFAWQEVRIHYLIAFTHILETGALPPHAPVQAKTAREKHCLAVDLFKQGRLQEAEQLLAEALTEEETSTRWNDWATMQLTCNHLEEAEQGYRRALELNPQNLQAQTNLRIFLAREVSSLLDGRQGRGF